MLLGLQDYVLFDRKERDRREVEPQWKRDAKVRRNRRKVLSKDSAGSREEEGEGDRKEPF